MDVIMKLPPSKLMQCSFPIIVIFYHTIFSLSHIISQIRLIQADIQKCDIKVVLYTGG
jgi:hypothetical protein